jgi:hypothetical protein
MLIAFVYDKIYIPSIISDASFGYSSSSVLRRFRYLRVDDLFRINYVLFPSGILPMVALLAFRRQDPLGRVITLVSLLYFGFFYFQAFVALHHFVPVMLLPLVVFWRMYLHQESWLRRVSLPAVVLTSVVALWLSLPRHFEINRTVRAIGQKTAFLVGDYSTDFQTQVGRAHLLFKFIPPDWEVPDATTELVSGYGSIIYYATRPKTLNMPINYIVQSLGDPAPLGSTRVAADKVAALYVKDVQQWHRDRFRRLQTDYRSPLYDIPRTTLFQHWGAPQGKYTIDLKHVLTRFRSIGRDKS